MGTGYRLAENHSARFSGHAEGGRRSRLQEAQHTLMLLRKNWTNMETDVVPQTAEMTDVLVIGGGQAGLVTAYYLTQSGLQVRVVDRHRRVGDAWRQRYDSLTLFTSRAFSQLPGLALQGDPAGYPSKDDIADYLEQYAAHHRLPVATATEVVRLTRGANAFRADMNTGLTVNASAVVIATGPFQVPVIPPWAANLATEVMQLTAATYRNPGQLPSGTVLVAGDGATGRQIALDLAPTHHVLLAAGKRRHVLPQRLLGRDIFWWMATLGLYRASRASWVGRLLRARDPFPGKHLELAALKQAGIEVIARITGGGGNTIECANGDRHGIDAVVWAVGYRDDFSWLKIEERDGQLHRGGSEKYGLTTVPGLYYVGRSWQSARGSALIGGVAHDAAHVVQHITGTRV